MKHTHNTSKRHCACLHGKKGMLTLAALMVALGCGTAGSTTAWVTASAGSLTNVMDPAHVTCSVEEAFAPAVAKEQVRLKNTGDIPAYLRAAITANWVDADGAIVAAGTVNEAYLLLADGSGWVRGADGFYYATAPVAPGGQTPPLIGSYPAPAQADAPVLGARLELVILASAVQADPAAAVELAWGASVTNGVLVPAAQVPDANRKGGEA